MRTWPSSASTVTAVMMPPALAKSGVNCGVMSSLSVGRTCGYPGEGRMSTGTGRSQALPARSPGLRRRAGAKPADRARAWGAEVVRSGSMRTRRALAAVALVGLAGLLGSLWELDAVMDWLRHARPVPFFAAMTVLTSLGVPPTPFFVVAGASFGVGVGLAGSLVATAVSLVANYVVALGGLRPRVEVLLRRFGQSLPAVGEAGG